MLGFFSVNKRKVVNVNDIDSLIGKIELIDIREPFEVVRGKIKTSKNIPMGNLLNTPEKYLEKNREYHIICQSGGRSSSACSSLSKMGFNVVDVSGGYGSYLGTNRN